MKPITTLAALVLACGCIPTSGGSDGEVYAPPCDIPATPCDDGAVPHLVNGSERVDLAKGPDYVAVCAGRAVLATACLDDAASAVKCNINGSVVDGLPRCSDIDAEQSDVGTTGPTSPFLPPLPINALSDCERDCVDGKCGGPLVYTANLSDGDIQIRCDDEGRVRDVLRPDVGCAWAGTALERWGVCEMPAPVFQVIAR